MSDSSDELVVVGPGVLGLQAARLYRAAPPAARVTLKFRRADPSRAARRVRLGRQAILISPTDSISIALFV